MLVNSNYFINDDVVDDIVEAVRLVAREGWKLLGDYRFDPVSGVVAAAPGRSSRRCGSATSATPRTERCAYPRHDFTARVAVLDDYLDDARPILPEARPSRAEDVGQVSIAFDHLRWFDLPAISLKAEG